MAIMEQLAEMETEQAGETAVSKALSKRGRLKVAYIMSRFPKLTETFILFEILALEQQGEQVELYPLLRARNTAAHPEGASVLTKIVERLRPTQGEVKMHPEARPLVARANFFPFLSWDIIKSHFYYLLRKPVVYFHILWVMLRANWGSWNYLLGALGVFPKSVHFARLMKADGITHVHAHFANHPPVAAYIIKRLADIPYSFTAHGADLQVDQHMLREKVTNALFVAAISEYNKEFIISHCGEQYRDKVKLVYCGVDTNVFHPGDKAEQREAGNTFFDILCTGTMYEVKGHTYLIEACRLLKERGIKFLCHLVGDGPYRPALTEQVMQSGLSDQVFFHGQRTRQEISDLLRAVDVVSMPSIPTSSGRREGIPVVLMEAMSSGVPVVASGISGIPELVEDGVSGLLVPPRDPQALADALERLHEDAAWRRQLGQGGRDTVLRDFDLHRNAAGLAERFNRERLS